MRWRKAQSIVILVALAASLASAGQALADGDPASDMLITQSLFYPILGAKVPSSVADCARDWPGSSNAADNAKQKKQLCFMADSFYTKTSASCLVMRNDFTTDGPRGQLLPVTGYF